MILSEATERDLPAILAIYNHAVLHTTAIWSDTSATLPERVAWLAAKQDRGFPVLVAKEGQAVLGFASYGDFRSFPGYRHTVEHSVYVDPAHHRKGVGRVLMQALIDHARAAGHHAMIAAIDADNHGSITLHHALGFTQTGRLPEVGRKFDRWLDLVLLQRLL